MTGTIDLFETILIPTDGSDGALAGAKRGIDLAGAVGADVHVLSVVENELKAASSASDVEEHERQASMDAAAESAVKTVADLLGERRSDLDVTTAVERGTAYRVIGEYVEAAGIDAVAMGTTGRTGLDRVLLGSVAERVLRTVAVPVLAVPAAAIDTPLTQNAVEHVLVPTDGSEGATVAVDWGVGLADVYDATCHALFSADAGRFTGGAAPSTVLTDLATEEERAALETVRERARAAGVEVAETATEGPPVRDILEYVDDAEIDLVVMGTSGRSGLERHLLGSVTENVVRHADVPVCCVPMTGD